MKGQLVIRPEVQAVWKIFRQNRHVLSWIPERSVHQYTSIPKVGRAMRLGLATRGNTTLCADAVLEAMHAGVNAVPLLVPANVVRIEGFNTLDEHVVHISAWLLITSLLCAGVTLRLFWRATEPRVGDE